MHPTPLYRQDIPTAYEKGARLFPKRIPTDIFIKMATITAFVMMLGLGWAYGADPLICTAGPSLQLVAGTTEVSAT